MLKLKEVSQSLLIALNVSLGVSSVIVLLIGHYFSKREVLPVLCYFAYLIFPIGFLWGIIRSSNLKTKIKKTAIWGSCILFILGLTIFVVVSLLNAPDRGGFGALFLFHLLAAFGLSLSVLAAIVIFPINLPPNKQLKISLIIFIIVLGLYVFQYTRFS